MGETTTGLDWVVLNARASRAEIGDYWAIVSPDERGAPDVPWRWRLRIGTANDIDGGLSATKAQAQADAEAALSRRLRAYRGTIEVDPETVVITVQVDGDPDASGVVWQFDVRVPAWVVASPRDAARARRAVRELAHKLDPEGQPTVTPSGEFARGGLTAEQLLLGEFALFARDAAEEARLRQLLGQALGDALAATRRERDEAVETAGDLRENMTRAVYAKMATEERAKRAEAEAERLKQEARIWTQEARTQRATVHDCYQAVTGATGEPGDWHGAEPIRALVAERNALRRAMPAPDLLESAARSLGMAWPGTAKSLYEAAGAVRAVRAGEASVWTPDHPGVAGKRWVVWRYVCLVTGDTITQPAVIDIYLTTKSLRWTWHDADGEQILLYGPAYAPAPPPPGWEAALATLNREADHA